MSSESWPPPLKFVISFFMLPELTNAVCALGHREWVAKCLGQITDTNRSEVQAELKQVISDAFAARTLWTTDWPAMQLKRFFKSYVSHLLVFLLNHSHSLQPKPAPVFNSLKRKR